MERIEVSDRRMNRSMWLYIFNKQWYFIISKKKKKPIKRCSKRILFRTCCNSMISCSVSFQNHCGNEAVDETQRLIWISVHNCRSSSMGNWIRKDGDDDVQQVKHITSFIPSLGQKKRLKKSIPEPMGASPVTIIPLPGSFCISPISGSNSSTALPDGSTTCQSRIIQFLSFQSEPSHCKSNCIIFKYKSR